jgi:hypothetical protein
VSAEGPPDGARGWYTQQKRYALTDLCERVGLRRDLCDLVGRLALDADWRTGRVPGSASELASRYGRGRKKMTEMLDELAKAGILERNHHQGPGGSVTIVPWLELVELPKDVAESVRKSRHRDAIDQDSQPSERNDAIYQHEHDAPTTVETDAISDAISDAIYREGSRHYDAIYQGPLSVSQDVTEYLHVREENGDGDTNRDAGERANEATSHFKHASRPLIAGKCPCGRPLPQPDRCECGASRTRVWHDPIAGSRHVSYCVACEPIVGGEIGPLTDWAVEEQL